MNASAGLRYAGWSLGSGLLVASIVTLLARSQGRAAIGWGLLGWSVMVLIGVAGGAWLAALHGSSGPRFLVAMGTCMLARLFGAAAGALAAGMHGTRAVLPYLAGLGAGYVPLQLFEIGWFMRRAKYDTPARSGDALGS